jgi:hypothetical protein
MEGANSSMMHIIYCKNVCKEYNLPPPTKTIKQKISSVPSITSNSHFTDRRDSSKPFTLLHRDFQVKRRKTQVQRPFG